MDEGEIEILKHTSDAREYKRVVLRNSLEVLLISDPDTLKCAAYMSVAVGADAEGLEGLAHLLEKNLFHACDTSGNSYSQCIVQFGGITNTFTTSERSNFYFDVDTNHFAVALDRFAQLFIDPVIPPSDTIMSITNATDLENGANSVSDQCIMNQLLKHLISDNHTDCQSSTGILDRLKAKGLNAKDELLNFFRTNYSANCMHLVVYGKESSENLQSLLTKFEQIPNDLQVNRCLRSQACSANRLKEFVKLVNLLSNHEYNSGVCEVTSTMVKLITTNCTIINKILVKVVPRKLCPKLTVVWPVTPSNHLKMEGSTTYLSRLIEYGGEGSLLSTLSSLGWAKSLQAGVSDSIYDSGFMKINIHLTDSGDDSALLVAGLLFHYISLLKEHFANSQQIFDEFCVIHEKIFHVQQPQVALTEYVVDVASNMRKYPQRDWLVKSTLPSKFSPKVIVKEFEALTTETVRIFWESQRFKGETDMFEPIYETAFKVEQLSTAIIEDWMGEYRTKLLRIPEAMVKVDKVKLFRAYQEDKGKDAVLRARISDYLVNVENWTKEPVEVKVKATGGTKPQQQFTDPATSKKYTSVKEICRRFLLAEKKKTENTITEVLPTVTIPEISPTVTIPEISPTVTTLEIATTITTPVIPSAITTPDIPPPIPPAETREILRRKFNELKDLILKNRSREDEKLDEFQKLIG